MNIFLFKVLATPLFIGTATLAGRKWGPVVNGLIVGLPLTTGPISFILAHQYGLEFAAKTAAGNLAGQISMCVFCLTYSLLAQKKPWQWSAVGAVAAYLLATFLLNKFTWQLWPGFFVLLFTILIVLFILPFQVIPQKKAIPPAWDLPARMGLATAFVITLTAFANLLGPQLSGLISTFPIFGVIFASFTHFQQGPQAAANLLRGVVLGSISYAFFFLSIGLSLVPLGIAPAYSIALASALLVSGISYRITHSKQTEKTHPLPS